jgi:glycine betaine/proline transport system substrate-binding protein
LRREAILPERGGIVSLFSKRVLLTIAAIALFIPVIAACGSDDDASDDAVDDVATDVVDDDAADDAVVDEPEDDDAVVEDDDAVVEDDDAMAEDDDAVVEDDDEAAMDDEDDAVADDDAAADAPQLEGEITFGYIEGWDEGVAASYLWAAILEDHGMTVNMEPIAEAGILYQGVASQDIDIYIAAWLPLTHESYWDNFGDDLESLNVWYEDAVLALSVPQYVADDHGITSLADLADNADLFDSTITGIEPGAGMMALAMDEVMPTYGLEDWNLLESSTAAMLTEWSSAYNNEEPIVVTLWEPHWAYAEWEVHNLEDPEGAWGEADGLESVAWAGFSDEYPEVADLLANFYMEAEEIGELMDYVTVQAEDGEQMDYTRQWLEDGGQDIVDGWMN